MTVQPRSRAIAFKRPAELAEERAAALAQRRAWTYLWMAFLIWCALAVWGVLAGNSWRKTSFTTPAAQLVAKRGIVLYQGPRDAVPLSVSENTDLEEGGMIEVPASADATLQLRVDNSLVQLRPGSKLRLATMRVGRFSRELTQVQLEQLQGAAIYSIAGELPDGREVEVRTPHTPDPQDGIKLTKGEYLLWVQPSVTRLTSYNGQAKAEVSDSVYRVRDNRWAVIGPDRPDLRQSMELPEHLLRNRDFSRGLGDAWSPIDIGEKGRPDVGGQRTVVDDAVGDQPIRALRLSRVTAKDTHNETGLRQELNRDISAYRVVKFSALVKVISSSLDGGGYAGSEYPVLLRINYIAENGGSYTWTHGFYTHNESNRPADIGQQIAPDQWHRYTLDLTALRERPAFISSVEVLASGHDFEAQVANVELTVE